jgi:hypothetical protein
VVSTQSTTRFLGGIFFFFFFLWGENVTNNQVPGTEGGSG